MTKNAFDEFQRRIMATRLAGALSVPSSETSAIHFLGAPLPVRRREFSVLSPAAATIVFVFDDDDKRPAPPEILAQVYGLTPAESRLAAALTEGESIAKFSAEHHVSRNTLKSQLHAIFEKTGTSRQSELLRKLSALLTLRMD